MRGLSVLICAYQAEKTLMQCVRSVLDQGIDDLEILIVNDGSTDKTAWMADFLKYLQQICVFQWKNPTNGIILYQ
jgi:glycosyltransferase involved in cell wall biosynthesis